MNQLKPIVKLCFEYSFCFYCEIEFFFQVTNNFLRKVIPQKAKENLLRKSGWYWLTGFQLSFLIRTADYSPDFVLPF